MTWQITHTATGISAFGGPLHLAPPYTFAISFSGPVDRASVEAALRHNLCCGRLAELAWADDGHLRLSVVDLPPGGDQVAIDPTGGQDRQGLPLHLPDESAYLAAFTYWPAEPTALLALDPGSGQTTTVARFPQPYQTVSLSPDGRRLPLRHHLLTPGQSVGTTGSAYLYDLPTGQLVDLGVGNLFWPEWSRDGGLLIHGSCREGRSCAVWAGPGPLGAGARRVLYAASGDEYLADAHLSPDGRYAAVFAGKWGEPLDLRFFALTAPEPGRLIRAVARAAGVTQGPSGLTSVPAAWAPDGSALAYGDGGTHREYGQPMRVWLAAPADGEPRLLAEGAGDVGPWRPRSDQLALYGVGVVDRAGHRLLATAPGTRTGSHRGQTPFGAPGEAAAVVWSPDGARLFCNGAVYDATTLQVQWQISAAGPAFWAPDGRSLAVGSRMLDPSVPDHRTGGLFRADGTPLSEGYSGETRPLFSRDGRRAYLPDPGRVVDLASGRITPVTISLPEVPELGAYRPIGFSDNGQLLLALGGPFD